MKIKEIDEILKVTDRLVKKLTKYPTDEQRVHSIIVVCLKIIENSLTETKDKKEVISKLKKQIM